MKSFNWFLLFFLLCYTYSFSQQVTVLDANSKQPLARVIITDDTHASIVTDTKGTADISKFENSTAIRFTLSGYQTKTISFDEIKSANFTVSLDVRVFNVGEVLVQGARNQTSGLKSSSSNNILSATNFYRSNDLFLQNTLNTVPGVRMEMRSSTSQSHVLIRGMGGKSRFNVRDIKIYYNGIPLTEADGTTTLNDIDITAFGSAEVIKGPTSILYGSSTVGALNFYTKKARFQEMDLNQIATFGENGLFRSNTNYRAGTENSNMYFEYGYQNYNGYRVHSGSTKQFFTASGDYYPNARQTISFLALMTSTNDQFPGEVNDSLYRANPQAANQAYINKNIGTVGKSFLTGVTYTYDFTPELQNSSSIFIGNSYSEQPIEPFYNRLSLSKGGMRTVLSYSPVIGDLQTNFILGGELIRNLNIERHYAISNSGNSSAINFDREYNLVSYIAFTQATVQFSSQTSANAGVRMNGATYAIGDNLKSGSTDFSGVRTIDPFFTPLISIVHSLDDNTALYGILAGGFSAPTTSEISVSSNSSINTDLKPEKSFNYEAGIRGSFLENKFNYSFGAYVIKLSDSYIPKIDIINGVPINHQVNAGKSTNDGFEGYVSYSLPIDKESFLQVLRGFTSFSYTNYEFDEYTNTITNTNYAGNKAPGVAPWLFNVGLDVSAKAGFYANLTYNFTDKRALRDDNLLYDDAYSVINLKAGFRKRVFSDFTVHIFGGLDNLTNTLYSPIIAINQSSLYNGAPAYYNAAPGRNFFGALNIEFHFAQ